MASNFALFKVVFWCRFTAIVMAFKGCLLQAGNSDEWMRVGPGATA
ncbi:uncharacterized protein METZ01_LOCUS161730 [marine metagenome]|uniref:Uncharacterized protein n=1 Tax=marine metagenome TaxID=408172 RepID=A0A382B4Z3_9ZZZZ